MFQPDTVDNKSFSIEALLVSLAGLDFFQNGGASNSVAHYHMLKRLVVLVVAPLCLVFSRRWVLMYLPSVAGANRTDFSTTV
jgi:hypothetical protein